MSANSFAAFAAVAAVVIATPGPDTALTVRNTLRGGRCAGIATAAGVCTGQLAWATAVTCGISAAFAASTMLSRGVHLAGALYLLVLGVAAARNAARAAPRGLAGGHATADTATAFRQGLLSNLANPKVAAFFTAILPSFTAGRNSPLTMLILGAGVSSVTLAWLAGYAVVAARASGILGNDLARRALDAVCAVVFVVLGVRLATDGQP